MPKTLLELTEPIKRELDLETEDFIQPEELVDYFNHAIREAEAHIIKLGMKDKYFKKKAYLSLILGQSVYDLPSDIYSDKIIKLIYRNGPTIYTIRPMDSEDMYEDEEFLDLNQSTDYYRYDTIRNADGTTSIQFFPTARENLTNGVIIHYFRDANTLVDDTDICDLPEIAYEYIHKKVKGMCLAKENAGVIPGDAKEEIQAIEALMIATLEGQKADSDYAKMDQDLSHYEEST
jgi:hypothetical protein